MHLFKVWNKNEDIKKAVVASCFVEFVSKTKLNINIHAWVSGQPGRRGI
jgi:hypothetical protein